MAGKSRVEIEYCPRCKWLLRAAWMAQEILNTFSEQVAELALIPGGPGIFEVRADGSLIWSREADGGFPQPKELKQRLRDRIDPGRDLGHSEG